MTTLPSVRSTPSPILREGRLRYARDQDLIVGHAGKGDVINLSTGEVRVARIVNDVRLDTTQATLVLGNGMMFGAGYHLVRLYRLQTGGFFILSVQWGEDVGMIETAPLTPARRQPGHSRRRKKRTFQRHICLSARLVPRRLAAEGRSGRSEMGDQGPVGR